MKKNELIIEFPSEEAKMEFLTWMCDQGGEQDYWNAMEICGDIPLCGNFNYDFKDNAKSHGERLVIDAY